MKKGIILEIKNRYLVILTPEGEFIKGTKMHDEYNVGQEITFDPFIRKIKFPQVNLPAKISSAAVAMVLIICIALLNLFSQNKAYAYVSIDINPSVELVLNKNLKVIKASALNDDGEKVLSKIDVNGSQDFEDVAKKVLMNSKSLGFLDTHHKIVIASVIKNKNEEKSQNRLDQKVADLAPVAKGLDANLKVVNASMTERKKAMKNGISTGKYMIEKNTKKHVEGKSSIINKPEPKSTHVKKDSSSNQNSELLAKAKSSIINKTEPKSTHEKKNFSSNQNSELLAKANIHYSDGIRVRSVLQKHGRFDGKDTQDVHKEKNNHRKMSIAGNKLKNEHQRYDHEDRKIVKIQKNNNKDKNKKCPYSLKKGK
jgi:hypothetical protein